jgi:endonuclease G
MKKIILALSMLVAATTASLAWNQRAPFPPAQCAAYAPYGQLQVSKPDATLICRQGYFTLHDNVAKVPVWTSWTVTPQTVNGCVPRSNAFVADASLPANKRSDPKDYAGNGYDQGHIANDAHQSWDQQVEYESFLMSNMAPQLPGLNRGIWKLLESATGAWTFTRQHTLLVYAGSIYNTATDKKIGADQVDVPDAFFKIVIDENTKEVLAFLFPHKENQGNDLTVVQVTVADVEKASGITFALPPGASKTVKAPLWPIDFKSVADNKKAVCKHD